MKTRIRLTFAMLAIILPLSCLGQNLLNQPQKIVIDKKPGRVGYTRNRLLVSNYQGGSIVEIDTAGNQSYFIQGAGFVDGLEVVGNTVFGVGNDRKVLGYDLDSKRQVMNLRIEGISTDYLSSITYDSLGHLFISCPNLHAIYRLRLSDYSYWIFAQDNGLNRPNGILLEKENNRIVVIDDSPGSSIIHAISLADSTVTDLVSTSFDRPDGITRDKHGYYYVGGYYLPGLYQFDPGFSSGPRLIFSGSNMVYPTYDPDDHSLLITYYGTNDWERVPLTTEASGTKTVQNDFIIHPVYPNPSSEGHRIRIELKEHVKVKLEVYNSTGILVSSMINQDMTPGIHDFFWNGHNSNGKKASSGIYFIQIDLDGHTHTQKAVLYN